MLIRLSTANLSLSKEHWTKRASAPAPGQLIVIGLGVKADAIQSEVLRLRSSRLHFKEGSVEQVGFGSIAAQEKTMRAARSSLVVLEWVALILMLQMTMWRHQYAE